MKRCIKALAFILVVVCVIAALPSYTARAYGKLRATDVTVSSGVSSQFALCDGDWTNRWVSGETGTQTVSFFYPVADSLDGLYSVWYFDPVPWTLYSSQDGENWVKVGDYGRQGMAEEYVPLSQQGVYLRMEAEERMIICELLFHHAEDTKLHIWEPTPEKTDLMVVTAHPDDEILFFGCVLPIYAHEQGKNVTVVYMTCSNNRRRHEALEGLWRAGVHQYPVFLDMKDKRASTMELALSLWGDGYGTRQIAEAIRRYKPDVVLTHAIDGEYGHVQHKLTSRVVREAVLRAGDMDYCPSSAWRLGTWKVAKLYIHLEERDSLTLEADTSLPDFDGMTAFQVCQYAYKAHSSQKPKWMALMNSRQYDMRKFGLYYSRVGEDEAHNDLFEHIA